MHPSVIVVDEVGYLTYGTDAANMLFHVVNDRHRKKRAMIFTTNTPLTAWGRVLHDEDLGHAIVDRILERGRLLTLDGPSLRTKHLGLSNSRLSSSSTRLWVEASATTTSKRSWGEAEWVWFMPPPTPACEIYVQAYPGPGPKIQVSTHGGTDPIWSGAGGKLFYGNGDKMTAASVTTQPTFNPSTPRTLWEGRYAQGMSSVCGPPGPSFSNYEVTADGQRFLMIKSSDTESFPSQVNVVLNWTEELKQRLQQQK